MTWKGIGPLSYSGAGKVQKSEAPVLTLRVQPPPPQCGDSDTFAHSSSAAMVHPDDLAHFDSFLQGAPAFLQHASGSDCLIALVADGAVAKGTLRMAAVERFNMRVVCGEKYAFSVWEGPEQPELFDLQEVHLEVKPLHHHPSGHRQDPGALALVPHARSHLCVGLSQKPCGSQAARCAVACLHGMRSALHCTIIFCVCAAVVACAHRSKHISCDRPLRHDSHVASLAPLQRSVDQLALPSVCERRRRRGAPASGRAAADAAPACCAHGARSRRASADNHVHQRPDMGDARVERGRA